MKKLQLWLKEALTEPNNETVCFVRVLALVGFVYALGTHAYTVYSQHAAFDLQEFGIAYGTMLAGLGAALGIKTDAKE